MSDLSSIKEEDIVLLLLYSILNAWNEKSDLKKTNYKYLTSLKLHKIGYDVSEDLDLPITRSWYIRGCYINNPHLMRKEYAIDLFNDPRHIQMPNGKIVNINNLISENSRLYSSMCYRVKESIESSKIIFTKERDYLNDLYRLKCPEIYSPSYQHSYKYSSFLIDLDKISYSQKGSLLDFGLVDEIGLYDACKNLTTNLHITIRRRSEFRPYFDIIRTFTDFVEDLLMKLDINYHSSKTTPSFTVFEFLKSLDDFYLESVWKVFAKIITINTVKGERKEQIIGECNRYLSNLSELNNRLDDRSNTATNLGIVMDSQEYIIKVNSVSKQNIEKIYLSGNLLERSNKK